MGGSCGYDGQGDCVTSHDCASCAGSGYGPTCEAVDSSSFTPLLGFCESGRCGTDGQGNCNDDSDCQDSSCTGPFCSGNACGPTSDGGAAAVSLVALATGQNRPEAITIDATSVYWTSADGNTGMVSKVGLDGGTPVTLATGLSSTPVSIAVDANSIYWVLPGTGTNNYTDGVVAKAPLDGGVPTVLASGLNQPSSLAIDSTWVYWTDEGAAITGGGNFPGDVSKVLLDGGGLTVLASGLTVPNSLAINASGLYWLSPGTYVNNYTDGALLSVQFDGGGLTTLAAGLSSPCDLALTATEVYWVNCAGGAVKQAQLDGGGIASVAGSDWPTGITVDLNGNVYWTDLGGAVSGGFPFGTISVGKTLLVLDQQEIHAIAVDSTSLYWLDLGTQEANYINGSVMKRTPK